MTVIGCGLLSLLVFVLWIKGLTGGSDVSQTPLLWSTEGQSVTMDCSHTKGGTYRQMYWYQQLPGKGMKQIVFTTAYSTHTYESGFSEQKFPATKTNEQTGSLTVKQLVPEDSGVYFCSVSEHSDTGGLKSRTNTPYRQHTDKLKISVSVGGALYLLLMSGLGYGSAFLF
uniref:Ig-like domain-containing protein n=1 Tax=Oreochromis aureus TaxID=47969 RepID=A0AAZ1WY30_OREAU